MKGFYLYGICPSVIIEKLATKDYGESIGGGNVFSIPYQDIEAIVSEVPLKEFESEEIQRKAAEDLEWIKNKALMHENVIERAMHHAEGLIIPMKFGVILKSKKRLIASLKHDYLKFKGLLENLRGKEERSVKIYSKFQLLENEVRKSSPIIQRNLKEIKFLPAGRQYFLEESVNEIAKKEATYSIDDTYIPLFLARLNRLSEELKENKILEKELTQKNDPMIFNGAFLVKKEKVDAFHGEIQTLQTEYEKLGFIFESSGPWPPFNFV